VVERNVTLADCEVCSSSKSSPLKSMHNGEALRGVSKTSIFSSSESGCFAALCVVTVVDVVADPTSFYCSTFAGLTVEPKTLGDATSRDSFDELEASLLLALQKILQAKLLHVGC
jgi:hypothetical protein